MNLVCYTSRDLQENNTLKPGLSMEKTNGDNIQHYYTTIANAIWSNVDTLHQKPISEQTTARSELIVANELVMDQLN